MNAKTRNFFGWLALCLSLTATGWVIYDINLRYHSLVSDDQVLYFGKSSIGKQANESISLDEVINAHLFGIQPVTAKVVVEKPKVVNAPKTRLNLKLTGLVSSSTAEYGFAMIEIKRGETSIIGVGKEIGKTGAKLHAIESNHILIDHRGKIEKLQLERKIIKLTEANSVSAETIKQLNLSEAELATLTQIGESNSAGAGQLPAKIIFEPEQVMDEGQQDASVPDGNDAPVQPAG